MIAKELVAKVKNLPTVSHAALRLVSLLDQPAVSNEEVVDVLKYDTVLTAKLLRACNSPFFGLQEPVSSVEQAVLILGHQQILHIVLSLAFGGAMSAPLPGYATDAKELWSHSLTTALAAEQLAKSDIPIEVEPPVAFTAGLLHDIGKLVINHVLTAEFQTAIRQRVNEGKRSRAEAEREVLGTDHGEVGACLLETWHVPGEIVEAAGHHHVPVCSPKPRLSVVIHTANCLAHLVGETIRWEDYARQVSPEANAVLEITPEKLEDLMIAAHDASAQVEHFMALA